MPPVAKQVVYLPTAADRAFGRRVHEAQRRAEKARRHLIEALGQAQVKKPVLSP
jgi:hypothetical protein